MQRYSEKFCDFKKSVTGSLAIVSRMLANKKLWGFANGQGEEVIPCKYDEVAVFGFLNGFAPVMKGEFWGIVNEQGVEVVPCEYDHVNLYSEGLAGVEKDGCWGFANEQGEVVIPCQYEAISPRGFAGGHIPVMLNGGWGLINTKGELVIPCDYEDEFQVPSSPTMK